MVEVLEKQQTEVTLDELFGSLKLKPENSSTTPVNIVDISDEADQMQSEESRLLTSLNLLMANYTPESARSGYNKAMTQAISDKIDEIINDQLNEIIHHPKFKEFEATWLGINDLVKNTNFKANIKIDLLDATKEELAIDFECNSIDITGSEIFKKVYFGEYDQFGGQAYGAMIGLYDFDKTPDDIDFLSTAGKVATAAHSPFIGNISPSFFGLSKHSDIEAITDIEGLLQQPRYGQWNKLRDSEQGTYIGMTMPRFVVRTPWDPEQNPANKTFRVFKEEYDPLDDDNYLWAHSSLLFARNLNRAFENTGWCQNIRGPKGGGYIKGLPVNTFNVRGRDEIKPPVECMLPDNKELSLAKAGLIPLIYEKGTANACFFSTQSLKNAKNFKNPKDSEDSQMVTNLAYTFSVCRVAHYIKNICRMNIGSTADAPYLQKILDSWIKQYITTVVNPDDLTLKYYPFKAASISVVPKEGVLGWYNCTFSILPHIQFEGMDVELRMTTQIGE
jgi:type VI secretion system protein ImpC